MTDADIARYVAAGYTHVVEFETWLPILKVWAPAKIPTTADAVVLHEAACSIRTKHGEIRNASVSLLVIAIAK